MTPIEAKKRQQPQNVAADGRCVRPRKQSPAREEGASSGGAAQTAPQHPVVCSDCAASNLLTKVGHVPATNDVAVKRQHRDAKIAFVRAHIPPGGVAALAVLIVDHPLPSNDDSGPVTFLAEDLMAALPAPEHPSICLCRFEQTKKNGCSVDGLERDQIFTANVDGTVVDALRARGFIHAAHLCLDRYIAAYGGVMRRYGGVVLLEVDVWGSFEHGAQRAIEAAIQHRILRQDGVSLVCFACSDRAARGKRHANITEALNIVRGVQALFSDKESGFGKCSIYEWPTGIENAYATTMQLHGFEVHPRVTEDIKDVSDSKINQDSSDVYAVLKERLHHMQTQNYTLTEMLSILKDDANIRWHPDIIDAERKRHGDRWPFVLTNWKRITIRQFLDDNQYKRGGDYRSMRRVRQDFSVESSSTD